MSNKRILVAPLSWGLGHATRCIPVIKALIDEGFSPIIASDGAALALLTKEFPELDVFELPAYNITYSKDPKFFKLKLLRSIPRLYWVIKAEKTLINEWVKTGMIDGIISDNRFGVYHKEVPSVYITHQINVMSGATTRLTTWFHRRIIKRFDACWIPDYKEAPHIAGRLSHSKSKNLKLNYIGPLSRFAYEKRSFIYDVLLLISGPEPQRTALETHLLHTFETYDHKVLVVRGVVEDTQTIEEYGPFKVYNFMISEELNLAINNSRMVICRSGYTTVMDLLKLQKPAILIPTSGQAEQEYIAQHVSSQGWFPSCSLEHFDLDQLKRVINYAPAHAFKNSTKNLAELFSLFKRK